MAMESNWEARLERLKRDREELQKQLEAVEKAGRITIRGKQIEHDSMTEVRDGATFFNRGGTLNIVDDGSTVHVNRGADQLRTLRTAIRVADQEISRLEKKVEQVRATDQKEKVFDKSEKEPQEIDRNIDPNDLYWEIKAESDLTGKQIGEVEVERLEAMGLQEGTQEWEEKLDDLRFAAHDVEPEDSGLMSMDREDMTPEEASRYDWIVEYERKHIGEATERLIAQGRFGELQEAISKGDVERLNKYYGIEVKAHLDGGAYVTHPSQPGNLGFIPQTQDKYGFKHLDPENIQWNKNQKISLSLEKDGRGEYLKLESKSGGVKARAYLDGKASPFQELKNKWEMEKQTFQEQKRMVDRDRDREMER